MVLKIIRIPIVHSNIYFKEVVKLIHLLKYSRNNSLNIFLIISQCKFTMSYDSLVHEDQFNWNMKTNKQKMQVKDLNWN